MWLRNTTEYSTDTMDAANENTPMLNCKDYRNAILTIVAANSAAATIKVYWSSLDARPDLDNAVSATNIYSTIESVNLNDGIKTDWGTWIVFAGTDDWVTTYEVNVNGLNWIWVEMTARTAGDVTISFSMYDNS